jgi:hypothetical protein
MRRGATTNPPDEPGRIGEKAMSERRDKVSRRGFIKAAGGVGLGSVIAKLPFVGAGHAAASSRTDGPGTVPVRPFGKTGASVSILSLGGVLKDSDLLLFRKAFEMGVTYWDTADSYGWGKNEKAIGKYLAKFPDDRKEIFLVTKAATSNPEKLSKKLATSLQRMNTSYVDMYFIHYVDDVQEELTPEVKAWAEKAKREGKIRFFGFSAHKNMENSMLAAAKLGWIDGIMMSYNYRLMGKASMKRAVEACVEAGIGLTAMKTQAAFSAPPLRLHRIGNGSSPPIDRKPHEKRLHRRTGQTESGVGRTRTFPAFALPCRTWPFCRQTLPQP